MKKILKNNKNPFHSDMNKISNRREGFVNPLFCIIMIYNPICYNCRVKGIC